MILTQTSNTCVGNATANLWEQRGGEVPTPFQIKDWYIANGLMKDGKVTGTNVRRFFSLLTDHPLGAITIKEPLKNVQLVWKQSLKKFNDSPFAIWEKLREGQFLFVIPSQVELDENYCVLPNTGSKTKTHAVAMVEPDEKKKRIKLENSKGESYGDKGYFYIELHNLKQIVVEIWRLTF